MPVFLERKAYIYFQQSLRHCDQQHAIEEAAMTLDSEIQVQILESPYTKAETGNTSFPHCEDDTLDIELVLILYHPLM